jgi:pSer/pThr/pTyr-binding forkhead associated (FHA) protein
MRSWVIGSSVDCDVVVDSPLVSARHIELSESPEGYVLNDLGSTNGTYVNGPRIAAPVRLSTGDSIMTRSNASKSDSLRNICILPTDWFRT